MKCNTIIIDPKYYSELIYKDNTLYFIWKLKIFFTDLQVQANTLR